MRRLGQGAVGVLFATALVGCSDTVGPALSGELIGHWAWVSSEGGIAGTVNTPASTGHEMSVVFTSDHTVQVTRDGVPGPPTTFVVDILDDRTEFIVTYAASPFGFDTQTGSFPAFDILDLVDPCCDGFAHRFERIGND